MIPSVSREEKEGKSWVWGFFRSQVEDGEHKKLRQVCQLCGDIVPHSDGSTSNMTSPLYHKHCIYQGQEVKQADMRGQPKMDSCVPYKKTGARWGYLCDLMVRVCTRDARSFYCMESVGMRDLLAACDKQSCEPPKADALQKQAWQLYK